MLTEEALDAEQVSDTGLPGDGLVVGLAVKDDIATGGLTGFGIVPAPVMAAPDRNTNAPNCGWVFVIVKCIPAACAAAVLVMGTVSICPAVQTPDATGAP